jgi:hypothetical protein
MQEKNPKQKLTLGLSKDVIERSKAAGINISSITEQLLKAITYEPSGAVTYDDLVKAFDALFKAITRILCQYRTFVEVARYVSADTNKEHIVFLTQYGTLDDHSSDWEEGVSDFSLESGVRYFHEPAKILENLLLVLIREAEHNKKRLAELKFALRFVKLLSEEGNDNGDRKNADANPVDVQ